MRAIKAVAKSVNIGVGVYASKLAMHVKSAVLWCRF